MTPHEASLGERARELLVAARAHRGIIARREIEEGGPLLLVGVFERTGPEWGRALDELMQKRPGHLQERVARDGRSLRSRTLSTAPLTTYPKTPLFVRSYATF